MAITRIRSPHVGEPAPETWSNCLRVGDILYIAGMTARAADFDTIEGEDAYTQARLIFAKIRHLVEAAGGTMADVVKLTIYVTDISTRAPVWRARREFFSGDFPTCALIGVKALASPRMLVEIEAVAHLGAA